MVFESDQYTKLTRIYVRCGLATKPINIKITKLLPLHRRY
jgi:hypothetical protein